MPNAMPSCCRPLACLALLLPCLSLAAQDVLIQAKTIVVAPDTVLSPGELLVRDGKVAHVGAEIPAETRSKARVVAWPDATIVPGFVLPHGTLGQDQDLAERAVPMTPELLAADAFDPFRDDLQQLARNAVTSYGLAPSSRNVAAGIGALVKPGGERGRVAEAQAFLKLSLAAAARDPERPPTSLMGAVDLLREGFAAAKQGAQGGPHVAALARALRGERRVFLAADSYAELTAALALAQEFAFEPALVGAASAPDCMDRIAAARAAVVLSPLLPDMRGEQLLLPSRLEQRGVPFCFQGAPSQLRASAALAVHYGTSRKAALAALTRTPAVLLGQQDHVGALRRGCDADFAVFDGDPLDLGAPLRAVWIDGQRRFGTDPPPAPRTRDVAAGKVAGPEVR
ncbi:MAG TPA: amidohydrolase family protein [Burkholderiaceae bacterium]|nr:amidohydrolase family protein [Burkholderiaceae bacterium]